MKILVTGATGFIGRNLIKSLLEEGHDVICLVRETSRTDFLKEARAPIVVADIMDASSVDRTVRYVQPDALVHAAASVMEKDEAKLFEVNIISTKSVCEACYKNNVERLVYLSSVAVISGNPDIPLTDYLPYNASNPYGRSKIAAERIVVDFRKKGLKAAIIRPCMIYGEDEPHAMDKILKGIRSRRIPAVDVPGMDSRLHLAYIGNVIQALELALTKEEALDGTFMIADEEVITIRKFLEILYSEMDGSAPPVVPAFLANLLMALPPVRRKAKRFFKDRVYDITRAKNILGYNPVVSTEEGLKRTVKRWKGKMHSEEEEKRTRRIKHV